MLKQGIILLTIIAFSVTNLYAQTPTRWRGPNGDGVYNDTGLMKEWPASGPEILWHFDGIGEGHSSPAIANGLIYLSGMINETGYIHALTPDGKLKWKASYGEEFHESYPGSRSTPVIAGDLLYIYSGHGVLTCMDANNGDVDWQVNVLDKYDGQNIRWGVTETVVVEGDKVYATPGGKKHNMVALNRFTGELIWSTPGAGDISAYCTPLLIELPERKLLVTHTADHIIGVDAETGQTLWTYPQTNRWQVHANTPIYKDGKVFCFSGYGQGGVMLDLNEDGSEVKKVWFNEKLDNRIGGMVEIDGYLYGSGDKNREWRCVNWETGEETYVSKDLGKGAVVAADGMLYCYSDRGDLALVEATPEAFNISGEAEVELGTAQHWSHPVVNDGKLYVRHGETFIVYNIEK
ncbi:MAG: PQQ-binding-like beta-propeller repeat protein [Prolixibacteraceae bacterium]